MDCNKHERTRERKQRVATRLFFNIMYLQELFLLKEAYIYHS